MGLNKVKVGSNMYQRWITHTWNPLAGACLHNCSYCSTNRLKRFPVINNKYSGEIRIDEKELFTNLGKGNFIFVCGQNDLFAKGVSSNYIRRIFIQCSRYDNKYLFQTKNPKRLHDFVLPENSIFCVTIETNRWYPNIMNNSPTPLNRLHELRKLYAYSNIPIYLTLEPLMDFDSYFVNEIKKVFPIHVNIGSDSGNNGIPEPSKEKILELIEELKRFTKVVQKKNLKRLLK